MSAVGVTVVVVGGIVGVLWGIGVTVWACRPLTMDGRHAGRGEARRDQQRSDHRRTGVRSSGALASGASLVHLGDRRGVVYQHGGHVVPAAGLDAAGTAALLRRVDAYGYRAGAGGREVGPDDLPTTVLRVVPPLTSRVSA